MKLPMLKEIRIWVRSVQIGSSDSPELVEHLYRCHLSESSGSSA